MSQLVAERSKRFQAHGFTCTAYLMGDDAGNLTIHAITRFDSGSFRMATPEPVSYEQALSKLDQVSANAPIL